ncbi:Fatty acid synthase [Mycena chlorophos]|uniref:beta-ketoacyl-[acyl-carrier-protein] synthase I n=1 Tax=Mycena chlorophos TaxID=658473 RepID=A0A8H6WDK1_MYCCL|nr:Fatty acid synthase [Mycena chlorophos]
MGDEVADGDVVLGGDVEMGELDLSQNVDGLGGKGVGEADIDGGKGAGELDTDCEQEDNWASTVLQQLRDPALGPKWKAVITMWYIQEEELGFLAKVICALLGMDLDYIIPFASVLENRRQIYGLDDKSELARPNHARQLAPHPRRSQEAGSQLVARPTQLISPLSPYDGLFGNDGSYSESKISLETLFQRWALESWGRVFVWTRGTGLIGPTNIVAHELESYGVRTFSAKEMAFNILGLMHPLFFSITQVEPIWADLNGGMDKLQGMVDLEKVMVITGYGEVGPWGSSRTRWEMEARGELTIQWLMGYIEHFDVLLKNGSLDIKGRFEKDILEHAGVRLIEPELFRDYDPHKKVVNQEIELLHDLEPVEVSESEAAKFKNHHGDKCDIWAGEGDQWFFKLKKGALVFVPKSFYFNRTVGGQIPTGWHAGRYGIPDDIIAQVDRGTLWALVSTAEALNSSGITDPYELYKHMHPSEVGTCLGSGMGGTVSMAKMFKDRRDERDVQNDILQETFINTTAGWINLLLLSSSGPVKIPVGACATALQSLEIACDTIHSGKAKVMIAGGFDDLSEEGSYEFANMKATSSAESEFAMGREPTQMSRPTTTTRAGFMEAQGTGVHIVMSVKTALELGCPIRGVLAFTSTSTNKAGRSIPAPGLGPLIVARQISQWLTHEHAQFQEEVQLLKTEGIVVDDEYVSLRVASVEKATVQREKDAFRMYSMLEGSDPSISILRRALAV